ncbi:DUF6884 domain-containing protein [Kitasatospora phosalacinea]|uniref:DUF6884 domain-containing protein n=1 Tax=Kitasatospora phosalacinea TaxID=2065 RepID=UPI003655215D
MYGATVRKLYVVSCGERKNPLAETEPVPAGLIYTGPLHKALRRAVESVIDEKAGDRLLILSDYYGLLDLSDPVRDYNGIRFKDNHLQAATKDHIYTDAVKKGVDTATEVIVVASAEYLTRCRQVWPHAGTVMEGVHGTGLMMARAKEIYTDPSRIAEFLTYAPGHGHGGRKCGVQTAH